MGRKKAKQTVNVNKDAHHRMNFLLQVKEPFFASWECCFCTNSVHSNTRSLQKAAHTVLAINPSNLELARFYVTTMNSVSRKLVLKL